MSVEKIMLLADAYAEAYSTFDYQQDQGTKPTEINAALDRMQSAREALMASIQSAIPCPADTGPIIP